MGRASREKGKRGEREAAALLRAHGHDARRGQQHRGGPESPDVVGFPGHHVEVKRCESLRLYDALDQAVRDAGDGEVPLVLHRKNGRPWVAILLADDYLGEVGEGTEGVQDVDEED